MSYLFVERAECCFMHGDVRANRMGIPPHCRVEATLKVASTAFVPL